MDTPAYPAKLAALLEQIFPELSIDEIAALDDFSVIDDWDSLMHVRLVYQLERAISRRLTEDQVASLNSFSSLLAYF